MKSNTNNRKLSPTTADREKYRIVESSLGVGESNIGLLRIKGHDCLNFLQRLSTNDMNGLNSGEHRTTVLTTEKGRIVDIVTVLKLEDSIVLTTSIGNSQRVKEWFEKFTITEDIQITDITADFSRYCIVGAKVITGIQQLGKELTEQVNPLEANLEKFVSFTKGCYIGQEVIARLDTYLPFEMSAS